MEIKFFKKQKSFKKENFTPNVKLFWMIILIVVFMVLVFSAVFGFYFFKKLDKEAQITEEFGEQLHTVKKVRMQEVLDFFSKKKEKSLDIVNSSSPISDPSL